MKIIVKLYVSISQKSTIKLAHLKPAGYQIALNFSTFRQFEICLLKTMNRFDSEVYKTFCLSHFTFRDGIEIALFRSRQNAKDRFRLYSKMLCPLQ